jgi:hypothetical protein
MEQAGPAALPDVSSRNLATYFDRLSLTQDNPTYLQQGAFS